MGGSLSKGDNTTTTNADITTNTNNIKQRKRTTTSSSSKKKKKKSFHIKYNAPKFPSSLLIFARFVPKTKLRKLTLSNAAPKPPLDGVDIYNQIMLSSSVRSSIRRLSGDSIKSRDNNNNTSKRSIKSSSSTSNITSSNNNNNNNTNHQHEEEKKEEHIDITTIKQQQSNDSNTTTGSKEESEMVYNPYTITELVTNKLWRIRYRYLSSIDNTKVLKDLFGIDIFDKTLCNRVPTKLIKQIQKDQICVDISTGMSDIDRLEYGYESTQDMIVIKLEEQEQQNDDEKENNNFNNNNNNNNNKPKLLLYNVCRLHPYIINWLQGKGDVQWIVSGSSTHTNLVPSAAKIYPFANILCSTIANEKCSIVGMREATFCYDNIQQYNTVKHLLKTLYNIDIHHINGDVFTQSLFVIAYNHLLECDILYNTFGLSNTELCQPCTTTFCPADSIDDTNYAYAGSTDDTNLSNTSNNETTTTTTNMNNNMNNASMATIITDNCCQPTTYNNNNSNQNNQQHYKRHHLCGTRLFYYSAIYKNTSPNGYIPTYRFMAMDHTSPFIQFMLDKPKKDGTSCIDMANSLRQLIQMTNYQYIDSIHSLSNSSMSRKKFITLLDKSWNWLDGKTLLKFHNTNHNNNNNNNEKDNNPTEKMSSFVNLIL